MLQTSTEKLIDLANHILAMQNDEYFLGHPEWYSITSKAQNALNSKEVSDYLEDDGHVIEGNNCYW